MHSVKKQFLFQIIAQNHQILEIKYDTLRFYSIFAAYKNEKTK